MDMAYERGIKIKEDPTVLAAPIRGTAGLQVVVGTSPVNLAEDPAGSVNVPKLVESLRAASAAVGYAQDMAYTLDQSIYANFEMVAVAPVILINVLDPTRHKKEIQETGCAVKDGQAILAQEGAILASLNVKDGDTELTQGKDYIATFDSRGYVVVTLLDTEKGAETLTISGEAIDPSKVTAEDIIGGYDAATGKETGLELIRQIHPKFGMVPGLIVAPGFSKDPAVAAVMAAKCEDINGLFTCECIVDIDCTDGGATRYTDVQETKEAMGLMSPHVEPVWPKVRSGDRVLYYSAVFAAMVAYTDAGNDDVPNLSASNKLMAVTGTCLDDEGDTEVSIDMAQANMVAGWGVATALNMNGFRTWGNNSAAYPATTDPKDRWFCCRRFFSWWGNNFILEYFKNVDDPTSHRLIQMICDTENMKGNAYVAQGKCAGASITYDKADNPVEQILDGKIVFRQKLAPFPPAEYIVNRLEFDPTMLQEALG